MLSAANRTRFFYVNSNLNLQLIFSLWFRSPFGPIYRTFTIHLAATFIKSDLKNVANNIPQCQVICRHDKMVEIWQWIKLLDYRQSLSQLQWDLQCCVIVKIHIFHAFVKPCQLQLFGDFDILVLGGMTKNLYHGIFLNYTGFTVYDGIYFFHAWPGVNHIFYWLRKNCSRLT